MRGQGFYKYLDQLMNYLYCFVFQVKLFGKFISLNLHEIYFSVSEKVH